MIVPAQDAIHIGAVLSAPSIVMAALLNLHSRQIRPFLVLSLLYARTEFDASSHQAFALSNVTLLGRHNLLPLHK